MDNLSKDEKIVFLEISKKLSVNPKWLWNLIHFESKWNPSAYNPLSSAKGLIQITDSSARKIGYKDSYDAITRNKTRTDQLRNVVYPYLKRHTPFTTEQSLYMSVFYPAAKNWPETKAFPDSVLRVNPGIRTPLDYMKKVYKSLSLHYIPSAAIFITASVVLILIFTKKL